MYALPISRAASPAPSSAGGLGAPHYLARSPSTSDFQIEKVARTPAARKSFPLPDSGGGGGGGGYGMSEEIMFQKSVDRLLDARGRQFAVAGRIPFDSNELVLFFRSKSGITHSLDFPIDVRVDTPPALDVLIAACRPHQTSDLDSYGDRESLFFPPNLPLTTSLEIANYPILDTIRNQLFPNLPNGNCLSVVRDRLEVVVSGGQMSRQSVGLRNDGRSATVIVTLPVRYRGGTLVVHELNNGTEPEKFVGRGGRDGDLDWVAFLGDCEYEIKTVQSGCRVSISYGVYLKSYGDPGAGQNATTPTATTMGVMNEESLITPSDGFFDLLSSILNMSRGKRLGFFLNHSYKSDPSEVLADSLVSELKGGDALLYRAFKMYKLTPELQWTAGGYTWQPNMTIQFPTEDITNGHPNKSLFNNARMPGFSVQRGYGVPSRDTAPPVRGAFSTSSHYGPGNNELGETEANILRMKVEESGGMPLNEAGIVILNTTAPVMEWDRAYGVPVTSKVANPVGVEHVYFVSAGELEKLVVNTLLVVYIP